MIEGTIINIEKDKLIDTNKKDKIKNREKAKSKKMYLFVKRLVDTALSIIGILFLIPIIILIKFVYIINKDKDTIFFKQERIGLNGKKFELYKFRTMIVNADEVLLKMISENEEIKREYQYNKKLINDPRITKVGKILRKTSLDELPQLINILKGEMSFIGNRPYLPREKEDMRGFYKDIIKTKPALSGLWQVSGRSSLGFKERLRLEKYYSNNYSFKMDIKIFFKTIIVVLKKEGAK